MILHAKVKILQELQEHPNFPCKHYQEFGPTYAKPDDAGMDLRACITEDFILAPGETKLVSTGVAIWLGSNQAVHSFAAAGLILPRSGLGHNYGVVLGNLVGLSDPNYQGALKVSLWNRTDEPYRVVVGERIAQLMVVPFFQLHTSLCDEFDKPTERGEMGFGNSGRVAIAALN